MARSSAKDRFAPAAATGSWVVVEASPLDEFGPESIEELLEGLPGGSAWDLVEGPTDPAAEAAEGFSALGDAVLSPWGSLVRPWQLPGQGTILSIVDGWVPSDPQFSLYSDTTYPLARPFDLKGSLAAVWEFYNTEVTGIELDTVVNWAGDEVDESVVRIAASILDSAASAVVVRGLMGPMGILGRRMTVEEGGFAGSFPLFDPFTTPTRRAIRRYRTLDEQMTEPFGVRPWASSQGLNEVITGAVGLVIDTFPLPNSGEVLPDGDSLNYEGFFDRPFNPVIGTLLGKSPYMQGFWRTGGLLGAVRTLLAPDRTEPEIACLPLNWAANNIAEFLPTYMEWLQWFLDRVEANGGGESLKRALVKVGLSADQATQVVDAYDTIQAMGGHVVVMVPEVNEVLLGKLLSTLTEVRESRPLKASALGDALRGGLNLGGLLVLGPLLVIPWMMVLQHGEDALDELDDAVDEALLRLEAGLTEAIQTGRDGNDALGIILYTAATALKPVMDWSWKPFWKRERNAYSLGLDEGIEEKALLGMDASGVTALLGGLFGIWLDDRLEETLIVSRASSELSPEALNELQLLTTRESVVPVMMLDTAYLSRSFYNGFGSWPAETFATPVDGQHIGPWVEAASPLLQLVLAIDTASALLEAGVQAESLPCALSGLATGSDTLGQQVRKVLSIVGMESLAQVLPGSSIPRFIAVMWRQAMVDRLLLDLSAGGLTDLSAVYELIPWMRSSADRSSLDRLLGPLDFERGGRRWEEGSIGVMGGASLVPDVYEGVSVEWSPADSLDECWARLTALQREQWLQDVVVLLDRAGMAALRALLASSDSLPHGTAPIRPDDFPFSTSADGSVWTWMGP